jgi:predicted AlkP superfamily phosphohydrolase/phosphomutase
MIGTHSAPPVVVIGLDVGDGTLIWEWARQGLLPTFNALITEGMWGWLGTSAETLHVSAWPSIYTGALPGKHGVYYTFQPAPGQQGARRFAADQYGCPPFWQLLDAAGKRCTVLDAPYTHPPVPFNGCQIFEWGTWAWYWQQTSIPSKLVRQLTRHCGAYPLGFEANQVGLKALDPADLHPRLTAAAGAKAKAVQWLMQRAPWDLFFVVFGETHAAAHYCWPPAATAGPDDAAYVYLQGVYKAIDHAIGTFLHHLNPDVTVFVISGDGIGPNYSGWHLLPELLQRLGYTRRSASPSSEHTADVPHRRGRPGKKDLLKIVRDFVPVEFRQSISQYLPSRWRDAFMLRWATAGIDWAGTRAFCLPTDLEGCIRINLQGREPAGIVAPGTEYDTVCTELTAALQQLINPRTGRPAVRQVVRTDAVFTGERRHYLPDLVVLWSDEAELSEVYTPELGHVRVASPDTRTGTHCPPGFVLARGPAIPAGQALEGKHIIDFAPTLLTHFGIPCPPHMDGHAWSELRFS